MGATGYITLTLRFQKEDNKWVGVCEELGTSTYCRTLPGVEKQLQEAVRMHIETLEELGERERFFKENNIRVHTTKPIKDTIIISAPTPKNVYYRSYVQDVALLSVC